MPFTSIVLAAGLATALVPVAGGADGTPNAEARARIVTIGDGLHPRHRHRFFPSTDPAYNRPDRSYGLEAAPGSYPAIGYGQDPRPNGGFSVNPYGYGNYTRGSQGGFGGYPAGSAGAAELRESQDRKCRVAPELC